MALCVSRGIAAPAGLPKDVETALIGYLEKTIELEGAQVQGRGAGARPADHQGRGLPQVPQGQRAIHQEADELVIRHQCRTRGGEMTRYRAISTELHIMRRWIPDWLAGAAGFEPPYLESEIRREFQLVMPIVM